MEYVWDSSMADAVPLVCQQCGSGRLYWIGENTARCTYCCEIEML